MASTITARGTTWNTTAGNKTVVATPAVGDLIVVIAAATGVATTAVTDTQSGTYVQVDSNRTGFSTTGTLNAWVRTALIPAASSTTWTATQTSSTGGGLTVISVSGMTLLGSAAVRSSGGQSSGTSATTPAPLLSSTPLSSNPIITAVANGTSAATITPRTGYTEDTDLGYATPTTGLEVAHRASGETLATLTHGSTSASAFASIALELAYNTAPTIALDTPADAGTVVTTTPQLAFTGTDAESDALTYRIQIGTTSTVVPVIDSYSAANQDSTFALSSGTSDIGQSFTGDGSTLHSAQFYLKTGTVSNLSTLTVYIYAHTGTFGSTGTPTGLILATSDVATGLLTSSYALYSFDFSGANRITLSNGTRYFVVLDYNLPSGSVSVGMDGSSPTHSGNFASSSGTWGADATKDMIFSVNSMPAIDKRSNTDTGFVDITNGAHTDPFTSGEQIGYTVQAGDALTNSTTYYWRVSDKDPSGTNTYGAWSSDPPIYTLVQSNTATSGSALVASLTATYSSTPTQGNLLLASAGSDATVTMTSSGWTLANSAVNAQGAYLWWKFAGASESTSVQATPSSSDTIVLAIMEYSASGGWLASPLDKIASATRTTSSSSSQATGTTATTTSTYELAIAVVNPHNFGTSPTSPSWNNSFSNIITIAGTTNGTASINGALFVASKSLTATGTQTTTATWTNASQDAGAMITTFASNPGVRSFTVSAGSGATVTQVAATVTAAGGTQTIATVQNASVAQVAATVTATGGTQSVAGTVIASAAVTQVAGTVTASGGTQVIASVQNASITQTAATVTATGGTQTVAAVVIASSAITQVAANVTASGGTQVSATVNNVSIAQVAASVTASGGTQSVATVNNVSITQTAGTVTASGGTQVVTTIQNAAITQVAGAVTASGGTQALASGSIVSASVTQVAGSVTATGGTQTLATVNNGSITQVAATVTATGGTQSDSTVNIVAISQVAASVTASGGTQSIATVNNVSITQTAASVTATGGTQASASSRNTSVTQVAATVTANGGTQSIGSIINVSISQVAASVTVSGGTQSVSSINNVAISQVAATVTATGGTQTDSTVNNVALTQIAATVTATGGSQTVDAIVSGTTSGDIKAYVGGSFVAKPVKVWNGSSWVAKPLKYYDGVGWITTPY